MSLYNLPNATGGLDNILIQVVSEVPSLMVMTTMFVYVFVFIVGMGLQTRRTGFADAPLWSTLGLISASFLNLIFSLGTGIIDPIVLGITIALTTFSALWLFLDRGRNER
tara:strand:- start:164 stop:493 length:330 start_codon:yes stop_codon:yes gene_type:complete